MAAASERPSSSERRSPSGPGRGRAGPARESRPSGRGTSRHGRYGTARTQEVGFRSCRKGGWATYSNSRPSSVRRVRVTHHQISRGRVTTIMATALIQSASRSRSVAKRTTRYPNAPSEQHNWTPDPLRKTARRRGPAEVRGTGKTSQDDSGRRDGDDAVSARSDHMSQRVRAAWLCLTVGDVAPASKRKRWPSWFPLVG